MDGDAHRASASGSSLDSSICPTHPASSGNGVGVLTLSGAAGRVIPHPDRRSARGALMNSVSLGSRSGAGGALVSEAAGGSTTSAEIEKESPMDSSISPTLPASSSSGADELTLSGAAGCLIPRPDIGLAVDALMRSMRLRSRSGAGGALISEAAGGSTTSAETEKESPINSPVNSGRHGQSCSRSGGFFVSEAIPSHCTEEGDYSMISTSEVSSKSGAGDSLFAEVPVCPVLSPGFDDFDHRFTPVERRATNKPERGHIVEAGHLYYSDLTLKTICLSVDLVSVIRLPPRKKGRSRAFKSSRLVIAKQLMTSTPVCGRIVSDPCSQRGHMYCDDLEPNTSLSTDPCSAVPYPNFIPGGLTHSCTPVRGHVVGDPGSERSPPVQQRPGTRNRKCITDPISHSAPPDNK